MRGNQQPGEDLQRAEALHQAAGECEAAAEQHEVLFGEQRDDPRLQQPREGREDGPPREASWQRDRAWHRQDHP
eukprot:1975303-Pyramimonas_sp.AAC.1